MRTWLLEGIKDGFDIINTARASSHIQNPIEVDNYKSATTSDNNARATVESQIIEELNNNRYKLCENKPLIVSALGAVAKGNGKIRLIHDASRPGGSSINDFWEKEPFSYSTIQNAVDKISPMGYLAKVDCHLAYRAVRIKPSNYPFTGLKWTFSGDKNPTYMVDTRLPFGARRSPYVFNELTQAVVRIMAAYGRTTVAYLDDFLVIEDDETKCQETLNCLLKVLRFLGFSINYHKVVGPTRCITFLGIKLNTLSMTISLPKEKIDDLYKLLRSTEKRIKLTKRDLQVLAGKLNFATQCIYGGSFFLRRIHDEIARLRRPWHKVRVNTDILEDVRWWIAFLESFNGTMEMIDPRPTTPLYTDACTLAAGAVYENKFAYVPWQNWPHTSHLHINVKETLAIEMALRRWALELRNRKAVIHCDNRTAVANLNRKTSRNPTIMSSLRRMFWLSAKYNFRIQAVFIPGVSNGLADAVSRLHEGEGLWRELNLRPFANEYFRF